MDDQNNYFHEWKLLGHGSIEDYGECYYSNDKECTMPCLGYVCAVVQSDQALDLMNPRVRLIRGDKF